MYNERIFKSVGIEHFLKHVTEHYKDYFEKELDFIKSSVNGRNRILEVGFGSGRIVGAIAPVVKEFYGIDYSNLHMSQCKKFQRDNIRLFLMDARMIDFEADFFDTILLAFSTISDFGPSKAAVLEQMKRVLKAGGNIIMSAYAENAAPFQIEFYSNAGFDKIIKVTEDLVHVKNDDGLEIISERFTKGKLKSLFSKCGLDVQIHDLTSFTYMCVATKKFK